MIDVGVEVVLPDEDSFLVIKETLTRMGISSRKEKVLYQSCHILHRQGRYFIVMFKEMFILDGKPSNIAEGDIQRRNTIVKLLEDWGLLKILYPDSIKDNIAPMHQVKIINFKEKLDWLLVSKYTMGKHHTI